MKYPVGELNNLMDISMDNRYVGFTAFSEEKLKIICP